MFTYGSPWNSFPWWIIPLAMMIFCFFVMRGHKRCARGWFRSQPESESAREILDRRYALGEISKGEYEEKKRDMSQ